MNGARKTNVNHVLTRHLGQLHTEIVTSTVKICRTASPFAGNGWLTQLPQMLIDKTETSLLGLLDDINVYVQNGVSSKDLIQVKSKVLDGYFSMIDFAISQSDFQSMFTQGHSSYILSQVDHLKHNLTMTVDGRFALWDDTIRAGLASRILKPLGIVLGTISKFFSGR